MTDDRRYPSRTSNPTHLRFFVNQTTAADLIVGYSSLVYSLKPLADLRTKPRLMTVVVDIEDIYDEFTFGEKDPKSVKDFLLYASSSRKLKPRFVLAAGDASYDPRNYFYNELTSTRLIGLTSGGYLFEFWRLAI